MVAVFLGWAFHGETLTARSLVASAVIIAGVAAIVTSRSRTGEGARGPQRQGAPRRPRRYEMPGRTRDPRIALLLQALDSAYLKRGWHGPVLRTVLKDLPAAVARHRPVRGRHSIWELALHTAYWKYIVRRRITGDDSLAFPRTGANFPMVPARGGEKEWRADLRLLEEQHRLLHEAVAGFPPGASLPQAPARAVDLRRGDPGRGGPRPVPCRADDDAAPDVGRVACRGTATA